MSIQMRSISWSIDKTIEMQSEVRLNLQRILLWNRQQSEDYESIEVKQLLGNLKWKFNISLHTF